MFIEHLLCTFLCTEDIAVNKTDKTFAFTELKLPRGWTDNVQTASELYNILEAIM